MTAHQPVGNASIERAALVGAVVLACMLVVAGIYLAVYKCDPHWMNRAGAAIVTIQVIALGAEAARRRRLQKIVRELTSEIPASSALSRRQGTTERDEFIARETERSERQALGVVLLLTAIGEILHGFGDLLIHWIVY